MLKYLITTSVCCIFLLSASIASYTAVTQYEVQLQIKKAEQIVERQAIIDLNEQIDSLTSIINRTQKVTATVYYPTGHVMRSGKSIPKDYKQHTANPKYIAISQDLWSQNGGPYSFGDKIRVVGTGYDDIYVIEDTMNVRFRHRIDILVSDNNSQIWHDVKIYKI